MSNSCKTSVTIWPRLPAGLVLAETGTVPHVGARVESQGHELTVEGIDGYKLTQIRIARLDGPADKLDSGHPAPDH